MYESPCSLQDACLDYICENIPVLCESCLSEESQTTSLLFGQEGYFPKALSDQFLTTLADKGKLSDETLSLFNTQITALKKVKLKNASVTSKGLRALKEHKIVELEAVGLRKATINDLIGCLGEWTLRNLRSLNVMNNTFMSSTTKKYTLVVSLSKLRNLQCLNVSNTEFNKQGLNIVVQDLKYLECLDISNTPVSDLSPLHSLKHTLKSLSVYNLRASHTPHIVSVLCDLTQLRHLDVSDDFSVQPLVTMQPVKLSIEDLLEQISKLEHLTSLDISGKTGITEEMIKSFLESHPKQQFLGLCLTDACEFPFFTKKDYPSFKSSLKVTGEATEEQLIEALRRYTSRPVYVQRSLYHLFKITQAYQEPTGQIIKLILPAMRAHPREIGVQMAATACLYNLSRAGGSSKVHPVWLSQIVNLTMDAMENFPSHRQLQKNALMTLCSDRILQFVSFDRFRCAHLVMECLCAFDDSSVDRMSVAICGILAAKIPTEQTSKLGARDLYMKKLLTIVEIKTREEVVDITLKFTLSALWNLTDESPVTCQVFLSEGGLDLFANVLETFKTHPADVRVQVETKILGLINNLTEVASLRSMLMHHPILNNIRELLHAELIDVSYFAAGILSHMISDQSGIWEDSEDIRDSLLDNLAEVVSKWEQPQGEMVAYRSFGPFFPLLDRYDLPQVQLWAVWAIHHVCTKNEERYCNMLVQEGAANKLLDIVLNVTSNCKVAQLAQEVLQIVDKRADISWRTSHLS